MSKKNRPQVEEVKVEEIQTQEVEVEEVEVDNSWVEEFNNEETQVEVKTKEKKNQGIGKFIIKKLKSGLNPKDVLKEVLNEFHSNTTMACVYWYKSKINKGFY